MQKIPLTLGFANMSGPDMEPLIDSDHAALAPLFEKVSRVPQGQIPGAPILFVYAHLLPSGMLANNPKAGVRQIVQLTKSQVLVLASPNPGANVVAAAKAPGPKGANLIFTTNRNGAGLTRLFRELFETMMAGRDMLSAWSLIVPQGAQPAPWQPGTVFLAEAGKLVFNAPARAN